MTVNEFIKFKRVATCYSLHRCVFIYIHL
jgi:hypothetical protein